MITCNCNNQLPTNPTDGDGIEWDDDAYGEGVGGWVAAPPQSVFSGGFRENELMVVGFEDGLPVLVNSQITVDQTNPGASGIAFNLIIPDPQTNPTQDIDLGALASGEPQPHAPTHATGGSDPLTPAAIGAAAATHGNTHTHYGGDPALVAGLYRRDFRTAPGLIPTNVTVDAISFWFADSDPNNANITDYADAIVLASWGDASGGKINMLTMQKKNGSTIRHYQGDVGGATWTLIGELEYTGHADAHALGGGDQLTPAAIGAAAATHSHADKEDTDWVTLPLQQGIKGIVQAKRQGDIVWLSINYVSQGVIIRTNAYPGFLPAHTYHEQHGDAYISIYADGGYLVVAASGYFYDIQRTIPYRGIA